MTIEQFLASPELLYAAHLAIEDSLVAMRDSRLSILGRGNGLVIREKDGTESPIIRMTVPDALRIGLEAALKADAK